MSARPARGSPWWIWGLALGYFAFYVPYAGLTKAVSTGLWRGGDPVSGVVLLPAVGLATAVALVGFLLWRRALRDCRRRRMLGVALPVPATVTTLSGLATAAIILTTTLNYSFAGISIVLALVLMRGGVLVISPAVDLVFGRRVQAWSWVALALSLAALAIALSPVDEYSIGAAAAANVACYLGGYGVRLTCMTRAAKSPDRRVNRQFFAEEALVASVALLVVPAGYALVGSGRIAELLREGYAAFATVEILAPALAIGVLYALLYVFGTWIYLDSRENTYCIALNRCSSLMSGVVAAFALSALFDQRPPSAFQLMSAAVIVLALAAMAYPVWAAWAAARRHEALRRLYLFVCDGNTSRSPMAAALCRALHDRLWPAGAEQTFQFVSAGLDATPGRPLAERARRSMERLGVAGVEHRSRRLDAALARRASGIYCLTAAQRDAVLQRYPFARGMVHVLDMAGDIDDHHLEDSEAHLRVGQRIRDAVELRFGREFRREAARGA